MPHPARPPLPLAEHGRVLIPSARYDDEIVERTQQLVERSRALLEETRHQVLHPLGLIRAGGQQSARRAEKGVARAPASRPGSDVPWPVATVVRRCGR